jgi:predicted transport protein
MIEVGVVSRKALTPLTICCLFMKLFTLKGQSIKEIQTETFRLEKDIQQIVENNIGAIFNLQFVKSEFIVRNFRIDTLAYDSETNAFVIIEYKKDRNFSVIDQGYTYMSLLLNNKADFILEYNECKAGTLKKDIVDWSQSRVIFVSPSFTEYQKHSVNFKDVPFELWEIKKYEDNIIGLLQHKTSSTESISTIPTEQTSVIKEVSKQIKVYTEEYHLTKSKNPNPQTVALYKQLREMIVALGDVEVVPKGLYISFQRKRPFVDIVIYQQKGLYMILNMKKGTLNDPNHFTKDVSSVGHWGNGDYSMIVEPDCDLDYVMFLIKQSYTIRK